MAFDDKFRLSCHAVVLREGGNETEVLLLKATYGSLSWGLPGGALEPAETIHQALIRECREELGFTIKINYLTGVYYHSQHDSQAFLFKCEMDEFDKITLSDEHSQYKFMPLSSLSAVQKTRVVDCIEFNGTVVSRKF
ncbi:NUDIX domain-containing protein [Shewanella sp. KX20019]|uniref:NUDIX hydrolase n=1 Tax=Shewanella sp. KX20019 TaxID=2803864 RepID=UPI001927D14F|nr:NUDIX domain-containing protein [Shewanella sp. KX20019]QQX80680.1 NUDIX domain-containing protein [Shewanella sp. KX20019]